MIQLRQSDGKVLEFKGLYPCFFPCLLGIQAPMIPTCGLAGVHLLWVMHVMCVAGVMLWPSRGMSCLLRNTWCVHHRPHSA